MHIYQIAIDNFKSFAEKTVIPFEEGFTTISGPNGSGKSNIIDSILFCLGLSTSRTMRAEKLSDLINNLSKRKEAIVTITFKKDAEDLERERQGRQMALELADGEGTSAPAPEEATAVEDAEPLGESESQVLTKVKEISLADLGPNSEFVQVTRRIKGSASGTYTSTYYLNGRPTTLTEIHDYLGNFNVSPGTYNVMMQGDVAGIVNMSPMDRRKIIDEIAGVAEFDRKIEQAQRELEATAANIERNAILLSELELRLEQLASERDHALKYQKLRDEKHQYEGMLLSAKYIDLKKAIAAANQNMANARKQKEQVQGSIRQLVDAIRDTNERFTDLANQVKRKGEDQQIALKKQIEGLKGHIERRQIAIEEIDKRTAENNHRIEQMQGDIARMREDAENLDAKIAAFQHQVKELQGLYNDQARQYEKLNQKFDALTGSGSELTVKRGEIRRKLTEEEDELSRLNRQKLDIEAEIKRHEFEMDLRLRESGESKERKESLTQRAAALGTELKDLDLEKSAFEAQLNKTQLDYSQARVDLNQLQGKYNELNREYIQLEARQKAMDEVNFARSVETILNSGMKGVHGTLAQLGQVDEEFALAMEIAIGGRIQNIVVDNDQVASEGIDLLNQRKAGRATFLPLNKIQAARGLPPLPNDPGVVDYAMNLIDFDGRYENVFAYALGDTLVVEDMQAARKLLRKYRMVTLDGSLLEKSGAMTGGASLHQKGARYFGGGQVENELAALSERLEKLEAQREAAQKKLTSLELKMEDIKTDYAACMQRHSRLSAEHGEVTRQLEELRQAQSGAVDVSDLKKQVSALQAELKKLDEQMARRQKAASELQAELEGIEAQLPSDQIEALRQEMSEVKFQMDYYDTQMRNVQTEIKSNELEKDFRLGGQKDSEERIAQARQHNADMVKERQVAIEEISLTDLQIKELEAQTTELDEELKKLQEERDQVQRQLIEQEKQKNILEREITQLDEQMMAFQARIRELNPQIKQVEFQLHEAEIDPDTIEEDKLPSAEEVNGKIQSLTRRMEAMEPVNMLAIEEYDRVCDRRDGLKEKIETLSAEKETITVKIAGYHELKLTSFMKAYENVDANFKAIFAELSDGIGELHLTNAEDPFAGGLTIHAQPRGKKMLRIEGLSGGEKSLTSLAFVFAIQRYMPAPFYALDEVDQNLDGINAEKLANMVKREAGKGAQFIVVSLRKPMIESSERTIGVTQRQNGITKVTGIKHREEEEASAVAAAS